MVTSGGGDWMALLLRDSFLEFSFDLGSGPTTVRSSSSSSSSSSLASSSSSSSSSSSLSLSYNLYSDVNGFLAGVDPGLLLAPGITSQSPGWLHLYFHLCPILILTANFKFKKSLFSLPIIDPLNRTGREVFLSVGDEKEVSVPEIVM